MVKWLKLFFKTKISIEIKSVRPTEIYGNWEKHGVKSNVYYDRTQFLVLKEPRIYMSGEVCLFSQYILDYKGRRQNSLPAASIFSSQLHHTNIVNARFPHWVLQPFCCAQWLGILTSPLTIITSLSVCQVARAT